MIDVIETRGPYQRLAGHWRTLEVTIRAWFTEDRRRRTLSGAELLALVTTKAGHPGHPLYVKGTATLKPWRSPW